MDRLIFINNDRVSDIFCTLGSMLKNGRRRGSVLGKGKYITIIGNSVIFIILNFCYFTLLAYLFTILVLLYAIEGIIVINIYEG